jgi:Tfp pilus assembly protein FimT
MLPPLIRRPRRSAEQRSKERGFTMALVTVALVAIIAMAALSIDIGTLYQAKAEAQRAADAGALTAARTISISGITGDPTNGNTDGSWGDVCGGATSPATLAAISVAQQNLVAGASIPTANVSVNYGTGSGGATHTNCTGAAAGFGVNPVVTVNVQSAKLPIFFARVFSLMNANYSNTTVSASATAEVFNSSDSSSLAGVMIPVQPRCVKPWIIPNLDPLGTTFVHLRSGRINNAGISQIGGGAIGETFLIGADCKTGAGNCEPPALTGDMYDNPPIYNSANNPTPLVLEYVPALVSGTPGAAPSCSSPGYQQAIAGCDQSTVYACGTPAGAQADLTINPGGVGGDTSTAAQCLISQGGSDSLNTGTAKNPVFPFQIQAGSDNPLVKAGVVNSNDVITSSNSIVTIPIANFGGPLPNGQPNVTIVGFLQVFINLVDGAGNLKVTVLNVAGCSDDTPAPPAALGTSPVPIRLITPP